MLAAAVFRSRKYSFTTAGVADPRPYINAIPNTITMVQLRATRTRRVASDVTASTAEVTAADAAAAPKDEALGSLLVTYAVIAS